MYPAMMNPMVQPYAMVPMQPMTIKIEITPNGFQSQTQIEEEQTKKQTQKEDDKKPSFYDMPKASVYEPKRTEAKAMEKEIDDKNQENTMAQALAAQAMATQAAVNLQPAPVVQTKAAEIAKGDNQETNETKPAHKRPEIVKPETMKPGIDLDGLVGILTSPDYDEQADAMEAISEVAMYAPDKAEELLDNKVVDNLLNIMGKDTSKMEGKDKELAERNKEYAMFTTATLQKLYADGVKDLAKTTVPADDLIGMAGIVNELKTNKNASVREAAVASIGYMSRPEYKKDLAPLLQEASQNKDAKVKAQADKQLKSLNLNA